MLIEQDGMRTELADDIAPRHLDCSTCGKPVCPAKPDGLVADECWADCDADMGVEIKDDCGVVAAVHDGACMEKYTAELAVASVEAALKVRLPLGMDEWRVERSRNVVASLLADFNITPRR